MGKDEVVILAGLMTREAGFVHRLVGRLTVVEVTEPPPAGSGVLL